MLFFHTLKNVPLCSNNGTGKTRLSMDFKNKGKKEKSDE
jgi:hypothetical protein